jgi:VanZ family protein
MLQRIKKLLEHNILTLAIIATLVVAILSLTAIPKINLGLEIKSGDKFLHVLAYFTLSTVWLLALRNKLSNLSSRLLLIFSLVFYGIVLELLQGGITNYRTGDFFDVVANTIGILLSVLLIKKFMIWFKTF